MSDDTRYVVGYDLNDTLTQISYFELNSDEPETLVSDGDNERLGIPTLLCKRKKVSQWSFGTEARRLINSEGESEVSKLLSLAVGDKSLMIEGESFDGLDLLILFVRKSLNLLSVYVPIERIKLFVFTVPELNREMLSVLERLAVAMPIEREKVVFQSYSESVYYYMLHQPSELWEHEVAVFDNDGNDLKCYHMKMNKRTTPIVGLVDEYFFDDVRCPDKQEEDENVISSLDEHLHKIIHDFMSLRNARTVYLLGDGFEGDWYKKTVRFLCMGRRVFQGKNMYSKGACYYGKDRLNPTKLNEEYIFLGKDKLQFNLGMNVMNKGREEYIALADGGENWFDVGTVVEYLLDEGSSVALLVTPLDGKQVQQLRIELDGIPKRPPKTTRLRMRVSFGSGTTVKIVIEDMGFGEIFAASGMKWEREVEIV